MSPRWTLWQRLLIALRLRSGCFARASARVAA